MGAVKSLFKFFFKFILVIVILLAILCVGLLIWYAVTLQTAEDYLPDKFLFYVKIDSLKQIYDNILDLKAADVIFSQPEFLSVRRALLEFKSNDISRNPVLKALLEMRASIAVHQDRSVSLVLEPGLLSLGTRNFSLISAFLKVENLNLTTIQKGDATIYGITFNAEGKPDLYFSAVHNLLFVSDKLANIESLYENKTSGRNLRSNEHLAQVQGKLNKSGMLDLYISTPTLIDLIFQDMADARKILSQIEFNDISLLSLTLSNDELSIGVYSSFTPASDALKNFLDYNPQTLQSLRYLPANGTVYSAINVKSFKDLFNLRLLVANEQLEGTLSQLDGLARTLFDLSIDDLLFNWMGEEVGAFLTSSSSQPVVFVRVRDRGKLDTVLQKLDASLLLDKDSSLVFNNLRLARITFPELIRGIVNLFVANFDTPYFYQTDDFIFFCMDPEVLADAINNFRSEQVLVRNPVFQSTTEQYPKNANLFFYYDLTRSMPAFFPRGSLPESLFRLYESGLISLYYNAMELRIYVNARGISGRKTTAFSGFPRALPEGTSSDVLIDDLYGSAVGEMVYVDNNHQLVVQDFLSDQRTTAPLKEQSVVALVEPAKPDSSAVFTYDPSGELGKYNRQAQSVAPFPFVTMFKNSFPPVDAGRDLLFYSKNDRAFFLFPKAGGQEKKIDFEISNPVLAPPSLRDGYIAFYPKSFDGTVFVITKDGRLANGWSREGGGISLTGPQFVKNPNGTLRVAFLTQAGRLNLWDLAGDVITGFPMEFEGTYYTAPLAVSRTTRTPQAMVILNETGGCTLVGQNGEVIKEKQYPQAAGRHSSLLVYDIDRDGTDEMFIYGGGNYVLGLDKNLELLPGFPVKGGRRPAFTDINLDGKPEMVTAGFDNQLYAYELGR